MPMCRLCARIIQVMKKILGIVILGLLLQGCATTGPSGVGIVGNNLKPGYSLDDLRKANKTITYSETLPSNTEVMGTITQRRCHRMMTDPAPSKATLMNDLKLIAYRQGADGFTNYKLKKHSGLGLLYNCWQLRDASATIYKLK
jgi:hypothetical protein|tara:strand:+ start:420 stop:851 length:432 start_codon:yes stop_codon:yes gene_type:complete